MNPIIEKVARAVYDQPTTFDGDQIGVHLSNSMTIDASTTTVEESRNAVMGVCRDAARAAIRATLEGLRDNVSEGMSMAVVGMQGETPGSVFDAMISQAITELDA